MNKICEQAVLYFYQELDAEQDAAFAAHLPHCPACQKELGFLAQVQAALVPPAAPQALVERVLLKPKSIICWKRLYKPVLGGVLVLLLGAYAVFQLPFNKDNNTDTDWVAYVSTEADREYQNFVTEFEAFEAEFE